jgi:glycine/D-amino acid oxidase-like deaminating enzyme/nitrite reductase/ring-hydroxylating ferredoxin subunit
MPTTRISTTPYWAASAAFPACASLTEDLVADVVVVGGGICGLTTAYLLARAGKQVVVLERDRCASADTGHTSAHLTMVTDARLHALVRDFGRTHAQAVWDAGLAAIGTIDAAIREHRIDAGFAWVDGYLHAPVDGDERAHVEGLQEDAALARDLGFDVEYIDAAPLVHRPAIRVAGQARVHPRAYLAGLAHALVAMGGRIFEQSPASEFTEAPNAVRSQGHEIRCADVVLATHNPLAGLTGMLGATLMQTKLALYTSYVVAGTVASGTVPDSLWWDTNDPYQYLRIAPGNGRDLLILGGADHKTGQQQDTTSCYSDLERRLTSLVPGVDLTHRWSGQVIETADGLPYIGKTADHQYAATGFAGNGLTFGTLAGLVISDTILHRRNPWVDLFDPSRKAVTRGLWDYLKENMDYPYYMIRDRFAGADSRAQREIARGQGKVVQRNGERVAVYRNDDGAVEMRSATCTHMGCIVRWNAAERTWDCPCHGSRFTPQGAVISGPAESSLAEVD